MKKISFQFPATLLAFLSALWVKAVYPASSGMADTDFYWHLAYGRWIVGHQGIPSADFFSWTFAGQPYQLTQWLGEAAMGLAYGQWGLDGTKLLSVLLAGITIGFAWAGAKRFVHSSVALCLALLCNLVQIVAPMRPQLFSFALLSVSAYLVVSYAETRRLRFLGVFPFVMALWANLHGGFVVGLAMIGLAAVGISAEAHFAGKLKASASELMAVWGIVAASTLATLLNPYGIGAIRAVLMIGGLRSVSVISEWMPVNVATELGWFYLLNLVPFVALMVVSNCRPRLVHGLMAGFFLIFGMLANRQVPMCAAVMAPLSAALLARTAQYRSMRARLADPSHPKAFGLIAALLVCMLPSIASFGDARRDETANFQYPVKAADFLETHRLTGRVLSDTLEASYLIHRGIPVFIDGRMDLYRDRFFFEWYLASRAAPGWDALVEKHRPEAMLLRLDMAIRQAALASGRWKQVFEDARYSILVPSSHPMPGIGAKAVAYLDGEGARIRPYMP